MSQRPLNFEVMTLGSCPNAGALVTPPTGYQRGKLQIILSALNFYDQAGELVLGAPGVEHGAAAGGGDLQKVAAIQKRVAGNVGRHILRPPFLAFR